MSDTKLKILFISTSYSVDDKDWRGTFTAKLIEALSNNNKIKLRVNFPRFSGHKSLTKREGKDAKIQ